MNGHPLTSVLRLVHLPVPSAIRRKQPGGLFTRIRWRLTVWYTAAMLLTLVLLGIVLYVVMRQTLLGPIQDGLQQEARAEVAAWSNFPVPHCPMDHVPGLWACFDAEGHLLDESASAQLGGNFPDPSLAANAVKNGSAQDTYDLGAPFGIVERYALPAETNGSAFGVVLVGAPIGQDLHALDVLIAVLAGLGVLMLVLAAVGGLFLADRALLPARIAYARQRDFIADASHELRTPLTMLRADAEVLLRGRNRLPTEDAALVEDMVQETAHMSALADSMLDLARLDAGNARLEQEVVDLGEIAVAIGHRVESRSAEEGVSITVEREPDVLVIGDRLLLEQAILALMDNSIKYNRPGGEVLLRTWRTDADGLAHLEVRDTGIGIPPEHVAHLTERFYRVDKARSRAMGGAGLGLAIVQSIIARHGGTFDIISAPDVGTSVRASLPLARLTP